MAPTQPPAVPSDSPLELHQPTTTLRRAHFEHELRNHHDTDWVAWLLHAIDEGVRIGYSGPRLPRISRNLTSAYQHPHVIDAELSAECSKGHLAGPYPNPPLPSLQCSGLGVVPKKSGKWRVIMHLSAPDGRSINDFISRDDFTLHYATLDDAITHLNCLGRGALMAKVDLKAAFRMIPVARQDWDLLGIYWKDSYYVDKRLPFGLRSSPYLFNQFADALQWILQHNYHIAHLLHYLDDYLIGGPPSSAECHTSLRTMLSVCEQLGFLIAEEKIDGPTTSITFLGIQIDSIKRELRLPLDKLQALRTELTRWLQTRKTTKRSLLSLIGKLSFAAKVVPAGRLFFRRLIDLSTTVPKLHHHIRINQEARADIQWWSTFLPQWNGISYFLDSDITQASALNLYTDASGTHGYGAYYQGAWFRGNWAPQQRGSAGTTIQWQELFAIVAAALTWGHQWQGKRILFHCDNQAIVWAWKGKRCRERRVMALMRVLCMTAANNNFYVTLHHLPGTHNSIADSLSRNQILQFRQLAPDADPDPTTTPAMLSNL